MMEQIALSSKKILEGTSNGGHDVTHTLRVRELSRCIGRIEGGDPEVLEASALLHDIGRPAQFNNNGVDHAVISARLAPEILRRAGFPDEKIPSVVYAIANHRFSSNVVPDSLEAKILQDADRLDISGAVGIAMTFAYSGALGRTLYHPDDPLAEQRKLEGNIYALDHILSKLLMLPQSMHTKTAQEMARERNRFLKDFVGQFIREITLDGCKDNG